MAVEDGSVEAVEAACKAFIRGEVEGHNNDFPPSAPKLAEVTKARDAALVWQRFEAGNTFIETGSDRWEQLKLHRGHDMPTMRRADGTEGWWFGNEDVATASAIPLPAPPTDAQRARNVRTVKKLLGYTEREAAE